MYLDLWQGLYTCHSVLVAWFLHTLLVRCDFYSPFPITPILASINLTRTGGTGQVVNRDYKIMAKKHGLLVDRVKGDDLSVFPIECARLRSSKYFIVICVPLLIAYGWTLEKKLVGDLP